MSKYRRIEISAYQRRVTAVRRHAFLFGFPLLVLLVAGAAASATRAHLETRRDDSAATPEMSRVSRAIIAAAGTTGVTLKDGREFAGFYEEVSATDLGESLYVTLKFQIFNYSDAGVKSATVRLTDRLTNESTWSFAGVSIEDRRCVVLTGNFTIDRREYEYWQEGGTPLLRIEYQNEQRTIELARMSIGEVQQ